MFLKSLRLERHTCQNCAFGFGQECRRHAPTDSRNGRPNYPVILENWSHWCGDWVMGKGFKKKGDKVAFVGVKE